MPLTDNPAFYRVLLENISDGVYFVDADRKIHFWNTAAERITGFSRAEVAGKCCAENILRHVTEEGKNICENGCPLAMTIADGRARHADVYLHHKDGHRVPVSLNVTPIRNRENKIVGAVEVFREDMKSNALKQRLKELEKMAMLDTLTRLPNRRYVEYSLSAQLGEMERYDRSFGVLFIDIDHFKMVNDRHGHGMGDNVLRMVANTLRTNIRFFDVAGRWGGEEFIVVIESVQADSLQAIAEKLRVLVEGSFINLKEELIKVTISAGATLAKKGDTIETIVKRADRLMYESKHNGRNRITFG